MTFANVMVVSDTKNRYASPALAKFVSSQNLQLRPRETTPALVR